VCGGPRYPIGGASHSAAPALSLRAKTCLSPAKFKLERSRVACTLAPINNNLPIAQFSLRPQELKSRPGKSRATAIP
jgi:hypothetical protein